LEETSLIKQDTEILVTNAFFLLCIFSAPLDDILEHYKEKRMASVRQNSAPEYRIFGGEELLQEFIDLVRPKSTPHMLENASSL
jgi:hypothetical protein